MAEYSKQTVAQLRQLLKDRSIPSTGLTRKVQIIEKLEEADAVEQVVQAGEPEAQAPSDIKPAPLPIPATSEPLPETISHIDSEISPPAQIKAIERPAEDATIENEAGAIQAAGVFNAPPADAEDVVGPRVTEHTDAEVEGDKNEEVAENELPDAPGPAAEALRFAKQDSDLSENLKDSKMDEKTASPVPNEQQSVEKPELLTVHEPATAETSRLNTEELEADSRKRKRRSGTPEMPTQDIRAKKHRPSQEPAPEIHLKEDDDVVMEQRMPDDGESPIVDPDTKRERKENTTRYKDLVKSGADETPMEALTDDRPTVPALHPVTPALYIRNFMRPLRPELLRAHLVSLATPPSSSPDPTIVKAVFLDAMKTHALVLFSTKTAASRARASLHGSIWPPEGNRKELWVDFIPEENVEDWIREEEDAVTAEKEKRTNGRSMAPKRFEVVYPESSDGSIIAVFQEVGSNAPANAPRGPRASIDTRRPSTQQPTTPSIPIAPSKDARHDIEASFKTLDELFRSTEAKPQLFYLPVSDDISDLRLKELDTETSRDWAPGETRKGRGMKMEQMYKYSFDDEDRIVEVGEDRGPWSEGYRGARGGGGFRGRGRGGGGYRGRGG
ncbi:SAP domain-containing protein [Clathrospora elynae]|uniref:SAP domain-containing protein n=1 Tax=Clathrospora elynae TaxID=706981 RepID=A0A6A5SIJ5_9PLEO|nr:SAP domain-containing protein [Clathrospora elynae]